MASVGPGSSPPTDGNRLWQKTWRRAVLLGPGKRTAAVWVGIFIVVATTMGGNGLAPQAFVAAAFGRADIGLILAGIWLLLLWPAARELRLAAGASFLRSLPHAALPLLGWTIATLLLMQLPIFVICTVGGTATLGLITASGLAAALWLAAGLRWPSRPPPQPSWRTRIGAQLAVWARGVWRTSGLTLVRSAGFTALAGLATGWFVRSNQLHGAEVSTLGGTMLLTCLIPASAPLFGDLLAIRTGMTRLDASFGLTGQRRHVAWTLACSTLLAGPMLIAAAVAWSVAQLTFVDGLRLLGFTWLLALAFATIMARSSVWAMQRKTSVLLTMMIAFVIVTLATGILLGLLAEQALLPLGAVALWAFLTVPRSQA